MWYTYVLKSLKDNKRYIGSTNDLTRRLNEHDLGSVKSTKNRKPFTLVYAEEFETETAARKREHYFKTHKGYNELKKIIR